MAVLNFSTSSQNTLADALAALYNSGSMKIYSGALPASANSAATGSLLCTITLPATAFGAASSGTASKSGTWSGTAGATGTAGYARFLKSDETTVICDEDITLTGGGGNITVDNTSIVAGGTVVVNSFTITQPA